MARIRTLKPDCIQHRKVGRLSDRAFRLWVGMITQADDAGRLVADPEQLRVLVFGYQQKITGGQVEEALREIAGTGLIRIYSKNGTQYSDFPSWADHQRIKKPSPSKLPSIDECPTSTPPVPHQYPTSTEPLSTSPPADRKGRERKGEEPPRGGTGGGKLQGFNAFWTSYPRKKSKGQAERAWAKLQPDEQLQGTILSALGQAKTSAEWRKDGGAFIPHPATWLNAKGWEDEIVPAPQTPMRTMAKCRRCGDHHFTDEACQGGQ